MDFKIELLRKDIILKRSLSDRMGMRKCAKKIGISAATLSRIENGKLPDILTLEKILKWLNEKPNKYFK